MQRFRIQAIVGAVVLGLAAIALAIVGLVVAWASSGVGCPGCSNAATDSHPELYFIASGLCVVASVVCAVKMKHVVPDNVRATDANVRAPDAKHHESAR